ncbi:HAD hydrolase-like protein [Schleiferiaceae bacterium]|nr:HAD hydrolase-like protein [Schleiferiaceae bacterium]
MGPNDFEVILWDFDGVIIDSNSVREFGFREVLKEFDPEQVEQLIDFHNANGGWSRYVKFRYFYEEILKRTISESKVQELASSFSSIMVKRLPNSELLIEETVRFIQEMHLQGKQMHIVSGSDGKELISLCEQLELSKYFLTINGSPTPKSALVKAIIDNGNVSTSQYCLIGDAVNDYDAANQNEIQFFGYNNKQLAKYGNYINDFNSIQKR